MERTPRLVGIDLLKGVAALAVAILHSGDVTTATTVSFWATQVQRFSGFAVPFFLITSFYLSINKIYTTDRAPTLKSRFQRLIIPYIVWSLVYLFARLIKLFIVQEPVNVARLNDPISVIFLGNAGIHLYFLPMLFMGILFLGTVAELIKKNVTLPQIFSLFLISSIADHIIFTTGNSFMLGPYTAFNPLLNAVLPDGNENPFIRVPLVFLAWLIKCLPYVFAAMLINHVLLKGEHFKHQVGLLLISLAAFLGFSYLGFLGIDLNTAIYLDNRPPFYEVAKVIPLLIFSIYLSFYFPSSATITAVVKSLGACSFGIYLFHQLLIQVIRIPMSKLFPDFVYHVSVSTQLFFACSSVGIAWLATLLLMKQKTLAKIMFGI